MDNLIFCLNSTVPIFLLMVLGLIFRKIHLFNDNFVAIANKFVFTVALPVLLFSDISVSDFLSSWDTSFVLFCVGVTSLCIVISFFLSLLLKERSQQGEFIQASYRSSAALLGISLIHNLYGNNGMAPLMIISSVPLYNIMSVIILETLKPNRGKFDRKLLLTTLKGVVTNPIILGIAAGVIWSVLKLPRPSILQKTTVHLANLATPLGLMAMGASIRFGESMENIGPAIACTFLKLVGYPALFLPLAIFLGFREGELVAILVMLGSATTVSCFIMAKNMGHEGTLTSTTVMLTTLLSAFTLTGWLLLLKTLNLI